MAKDLTVRLTADNTQPKAVRAEEVKGYQQVETAAANAYRLAATTATQAARTAQQADAETVRRAIQERDKLAAAIQRLQERQKAASDPGQARQLSFAVDELTRRWQAASRAVENYSRAEATAAAHDPARVAAVVAASRARSAGIPLAGEAGAPGRGRGPGGGVAFAGAGGRGDDQRLQHTAMLLMQVGNLADDAQYGIRGIVNNVPLIAMSAAGAFGVATSTAMAFAGAAGIVMVGINQLIQHGPALKSALASAAGWPTDPAREYARSLEEITDRLKELEGQYPRTAAARDEYDRLRREAPGQARREEAEGAQAAITGENADVQRDRVRAFIKSQGGPDGLVKGLLEANPGAFMSPEAAAIQTQLEAKRKDQAALGNDPLFKGGLADEVATLQQDLRVAQERAARRFLADAENPADPTQSLLRLHKTMQANPEKFRAGAAAELEGILGEPTAAEAKFQEEIDRPRQQQEREARQRDREAEREQEQRAERAAAALAQRHGGADLLRGNFTEAGVVADATRAGETEDFGRRMYKAIFEKYSRAVEDQAMKAGESPEAAQESLAAQADAQDKVAALRKQRQAAGDQMADARSSLAERPAFRSQLMDVESYMNTILTGAVGHDPQKEQIRKLEELGRKLDQQLRVAEDQLREFRKGGSFEAGD